MYKILFCIALAVALVCCYVLGWHLGYLCGVIDTEKEMKGGVQCGMDRR